MDDKKKAPASNESLEPKAPELIQNLKWLILHGWQNKWYVLLAVCIIVIGYIGVPRLLRYTTQGGFSYQNGLLNNGGFEDQFRHWGTGYLETEWYRGSMTPFWASSISEPSSSRKPSVANVRGDLVSDIKRSGAYSLKVVNIRHTAKHFKQYETLLSSRHLQLPKAQ